MMQRQGGTSRANAGHGSECLGSLTGPNLSYIEPFPFVIFDILPTPCNSLSWNRPGPGRQQRRDATEELRIQSEQQSRPMTTTEAALRDAAGKARASLAADGMKKKAPYRCVVRVTGPGVVPAGCMGPDASSSAAASEMDRRVADERRAVAESGVLDDPRGPCGGRDAIETPSAIPHRPAMRATEPMMAAVGGLVAPSVPTGPNN